MRIKEPSDARTNRRDRHGRSLWTVALVVILSFALTATVAQPVAAGDKPAPPTGLDAEYLASLNVVVLSWNPTAVAAAGYNIDRNGAYHDTVTGRTTFTDTKEVNRDTDYTYEVSAFAGPSDAREFGGKSEPVEVSTTASQDPGPEEKAPEPEATQTEPESNPIPDAPRSLTGSAGLREITLSWSPPAGDSVKGYNIDRNGGYYVTVKGALTFTDTSLSENTEYRYAVSAFRDDDPGPKSAELKIRTDQTPPAPTPEPEPEPEPENKTPEPEPTPVSPAEPEPEVEAKVTKPADPTGLVGTVTHDRVKLDWDVAGADVDGHDIYRDGGWFGTSRTGEFTDNDVASDTAYSYEIAAFSHKNQDGDRLYSAKTSVAATTSVDPADALEAQQQAKLAKERAAAAAVLAAEVAEAAVAEAAATTIAEQQEQVAETVEEPEEEPETITPVVVEDVTEGIVKPAIVEGVTAEVVGNNIVVRWDAPADESITGYNVYRNGSWWWLVDDGATFTDELTEAGIEYSYQVVAFNGPKVLRQYGSQSESTAPVSTGVEAPIGDAPVDAPAVDAPADDAPADGALVDPDISVEAPEDGVTSEPPSTTGGEDVGVDLDLDLDPSAPAAVIATVGDAALELSWEAPAELANLEGYNIYRAVGSSDLNYHDTVNDGTSYIDTRGLLNGVSYRYEVTAYFGPDGPLRTYATSAPVTVEFGHTDSDSDADSDDSDSDRDSDSDIDNDIDLETEAGGTVDLDGDLTGPDAGLAETPDPDLDLDETTAPGATDGEVETVELVDVQAPSGLATTVTSDSIVLTWVPPIDSAGLEGYNVYRGANAESLEYLDTVKDATSYTDTSGIDLAGTFTYRITAYFGPDGPDRTYQKSAPHTIGTASTDGGVETESSGAIDGVVDEELELEPVLETEAGELSEPQRVRAWVNYGPSVSMSWQPPANAPGPIKGYNIERDGEPIAWVPEGTTFRDHEVDVDSIYHHTYKVSAVSGSSYGPGAAVQPNLPSPFNLASTIVTDTTGFAGNPEEQSVLLTWKATTVAPVSYNITRNGVYLTTVSEGAQYRDTSYSSFYEQLKNFNNADSDALDARTLLVYEITPVQDNAVGSRSGLRQAFPLIGGGDAPINSDQLGPVTDLRGFHPTFYPEVHLEWSPPAGGATPRAYNIDLNGDHIATVTDTFYIDSRVAGGNLYSYGVTTIGGTRENPIPGTRVQTGNIPVVGLPDPATFRPSRVEDLEATGEGWLFPYEPKVNLAWIAPEGWDFGYLGGYRILRNGVEIATVDEPDSGLSLGGPERFFADSQPILDVATIYTVVPYSSGDQALPGAESVGAIITLRSSFESAQDGGGVALESEVPVSFEVIMGATTRYPQAQMSAELYTIYTLARDDSSAPFWQLLESFNDTLNQTRPDLAITLDPSSQSSDEAALQLLSNIIEPAAQEHLLANVAGYGPMQHLSGSRVQDKTGTSEDERSAVIIAASLRLNDELIALDAVLTADGSSSGDVRDALKDAELTARSIALNVLDLKTGLYSANQDIVYRVIQNGEAVSFRPYGGGHIPISVPHSGFQLFQNASPIDRAVFLGLKGDAWKYSQPYWQLADQLRLEGETIRDQEIKAKKRAIFTAVLVIVGTLVIGYGAHLLLTALLPAGGSLATAAIAGTAAGVGSYTATYLATGSTSQAEKAGLVAALTAGFNEYLEVTKGALDVYQVTGIAVVKASIAELQGDDPAAAFIGAFGTYYLGETLEGGDWDALAKIAPQVLTEVLDQWAAGKSLEEIGDYLANNVYRYVADVSGDYLGQKLGLNLDATWGKVGDIFLDLAIYGVASNTPGISKEDEIKNFFLNTTYPALTQVASNSLAGRGPDSFWKTYGPNVINIVLLAPLQKDPGQYLETQLTKLVYQMAADHARTKFNERFVQEGEDQPFIDFFGGLLHITVLNGHDPALLEQAVNGYLANSLATYLGSKLPECSEAVDGLRSEFIGQIIDTGGDPDKFLAAAPSMSQTAASLGNAAAAGCETDQQCPTGQQTSQVSRLRFFAPVAQTATQECTFELPIELPHLTFDRTEARWVMYAEEDGEDSIKGTSTYPTVAEANRDAFAFWLIHLKPEHMNLLDYEKFTASEKFSFAGNDDYFLWINLNDPYRGEVQTYLVDGQVPLPGQAVFPVRNFGETPTSFQATEMTVFDKAKTLLDSIEEHYGPIVRGCTAAGIDAVEGFWQLLEKLYPNPVAGVAQIVDETTKAMGVLIEQVQTGQGKEVLKQIFHWQLIEDGKYEEWVGRVGCELFVLLAGALAGGVGFAARIATILRKFANDRDVDIAAPCRSNSFPTGTLVRMADGTHKEIDQIEPGDVVRAFNTETDRWSNRVVTDQWSHLDTDEMATVTLADGSGVDATDHHLFWVDSRGAWVEAEDLQPGDLLLTPDGVTAVSDVELYATDGTLVWELTVAEDHTFTVSTGSSDVVVHNSIPCPEGYTGRSLQELLPEGRVPTEKASPGYPEWWDDLETQELDWLMDFPEHRKPIVDNVRTGGLHEWCACSRILVFKEWGLTMAQLRAFTTATYEVRGITTPSSRTVNGQTVDYDPAWAGKDWAHPASGVASSPASSAFHVELFDLIDDVPVKGGLPTFRELLIGDGGLLRRWGMSDSLVDSLPINSGTRAGELDFDQSVIGTAGSGLTGEFNAAPLASAARQIAELVGTTA